MPRPKSNKEYVRLRRLLDGHLRRSPLAPAQANGRHLDEDALSAFVEGRLSEPESAPVVRHLVGCGSCRNITAQLVRLQTELGEGTQTSAHTPSEEPGRIRKLLADLASRVLPSSDSEVFAYHAPADDFEKKDEATKDEAKGGEAPTGEEKD